MRYRSTRSEKISVDVCRAILDGAAPDGGLYVPENFPKLTADFMKNILTSSLAERMARVLSLFVDLPDAQLCEICEDALSDFGGELPLTMAEEGLYLLDLTCGNTARAEDISARVFARLVKAARDKRQESNIRVVAFAGSAACGKTLLDAFKGVDGVAAIAFVPADNLLAARGLNASADDSNVQAVGVKGENFDVELKNILSDDKFLRNCEDMGCKILDADGKNIGRALPYVACFVSAYADLASDGEISLGDKINFALPAGDMSAAIAGIYARQMGLPIDRLTLAFNSNNAVIDLIANGEFCLPKKAVATCAPEMDVLMPANLERLVFELTNRDAARTAEAMRGLKEEGKISLGDVTDSAAYDAIVAGWADDDDIKETAYNIFDMDDIVLDAHDAATASVYNDYCNESADDTPAVIWQTVHPYVYATNTLGTLGVKEPDSIKATAKLELLTALERPRCIEEALSSRDEDYDWVILESWMSDTVIDFMKRLV